MDRTNPQNYGPQARGLQPTGFGRPPEVEPIGQPVTDFTAPLEDGLKQLEDQPEFGFVARAVAANQSKVKGLDGIMQLAWRGISPDDVKKTLNASQAAQSAREMAESSVLDGLDDTQFEGLLQQLQAEMQNQPQMPQMQQAQAPSRGQMLLSALGSLMSPRHAFEIGAVPFQYQQQQAEQAYAQDVQRFQVSTAQRKERMDTLQNMAKLELDRTKGEAEYRQKRNEARDKSEGGAINRIMQANRPGEAALALRDLAKINPELAANYKPLVDEIEADAKLKFDNEQAGLKARTQATELRNRRIETLLPFEVQDKTLKNQLDGLKVQLAQSDVRMIPKEEELMSLRVDMSRMKNQFYPQEVAFKAQMAAFYASMTAQNYALAVDKFNTDKSQWSYQQMLQAQTQHRTMVGQKIESLESDLKYAQQEWEAAEKDSPEKKAWARWKEKLQQSIIDARAELGSLSFSSPPEQTPNTSSAPQPPQAPNYGFNPVTPGVPPGIGLSGTPPPPIPGIGSGGILDPAQLQKIIEAEVQRRMAEQNSFNARDKKTKKPVVPWWQRATGVVTSGDGYVVRPAKK